MMIFLMNAPVFDRKSDQLLNIGNKFGSSSGISPVPLLLTIEFVGPPGPMTHDIRY